MKQQPLSQYLLPLEPQFRERVWGGQKLKPADPPVGEAWIAFEDSLVRSGAEAGRTVEHLTHTYREELLGRDAVARFGVRFPLLVKLLDCADWLSVQVHPNDEQAARLVRPGEYGKTEAWHFLEVDEGASILAGVTPGTADEALARAIREGRVLDVARRESVHAADTAFIPAGTLHALGPGMLLYEVQQASDTTYRVYDWDRPASAGRELHIEQSVAVARADAQPLLRRADSLGHGGRDELVNCPYFVLERLRPGAEPLAGDTGGRVFHILTVLDGQVSVERAQERVTLGRHETLLVAGAAGEYRLSSVNGDAALLRASAPLKE